MAVKNSDVKNDRLIPVVIAGVTYYMNFSLFATKKLTKLFGKGSALAAIEAGGADSLDEGSIDELLEMCAVLIQQGAEYRRLVEREETPSLTADELGVLADISDLNNLIGKFNKAVKAGSAREIEVKPDRKNGGTAAKA